MRLPFLQMESDLLAHGGPEVAALAGCSVPAALGHIAMVRAWAVSMADDSAPPDGFVPGEAAGRRIEAAAQWAGERGRLLQAFQDAGQVRVESDGIRVLHLEPYAKAWGANHTSRQRMRKLRERSTNTDEHPRTEAARSAKFDGQTQTQTQTQTQKAEDLPASQESARAVPAREPLVLDGQQPERPAKRPTNAKAPREPEGDPRHRPLADALVAAGYPFHGGRSAKAVSDLLALADQREGSRGEAARAEIMRRARIGWAWVGFPSCRSIPELAAHWGHYEHEQQARGQGPPDVRKGGVRAELMDHNAPQEPF